MRMNELLRKESVILGPVQFIKSSGTFKFEECSILLSFLASMLCVLYVQDLIR